MVRRRQVGRSVSPTTGTVLLVGIVVLLAILVTQAATGLATTTEPAPLGTFEVEYVPTGAGNYGTVNGTTVFNGPYLNVTHVGGTTADGTRLFVVDGDGNEVAWADVWTGGETVESGEFLHIDGEFSDGALNHVCPGEAYRLVWRSESGWQAILAETTVPDGEQTLPDPTWCD
ncbi:type IV pilin [Haloarchaeobius amylolyticus]|uniref:type IV pilin n=1 Tax=Haloarchaeobius amylolyticus TaxID=1198296 RepID=UPI00226E8CD5|nr:type IV pilin [Haloarchaeobius amylolyticus]